MNYEVHCQCMKCGRRFSYKSDDGAERKLCPNTGAHEGERPVPRPDDDGKP